jgi:ParB family transcriptional regulator, chromosome partitioning protein
VSKDRRLGRGLAALLGTPLEEQLAAAPRGAVVPPAVPSNIRSGSVSAASTIEGYSAEPELTVPTASTLDLANQSTPASATTGLLQLPLAEIEENPFQPRRDFSDAEIVSLAESLKEHDLLQPILVRRVAGKYQLISGERRLRAARHAGWTTIPARLREADDRLVAELAIVENLQRKDLNPVEKALSFKRYLDEHRCTQDDLARRLKIDRSTIANLMRLLELPGCILDGLRQGTITAGHARALLPLGDEHEQVALAERIQSEGLSVREVERIVSEQIGGEGEDAESPDILPGPGKTRRTKTDQIASLEQEFRHALGLKVEIKANSRGRGKLVIHFANHDEFDRLRDSLSDAADVAPRRKAA